LGLTNYYSAGKEIEMLREKSVNKPRSTQWPYDVDYYKESDVYADVLILGGGIAGCHAAINASRAGAKVVIVEKASVIRSGSGGSGVDHWHNAYTNPCSKITPDEVTELRDKLGLNLPEGYGSGHVRYIEAKESYDALLDMEKMGMKIRDVNDEFVGAEFRDNDTKLMFAYDYENKHVIRVPGANVKLILYRELKRLGVKIYDRVMSTSLLTADGRPGARVIGATGVNTRTGEFYVFKSKATILCTAEALRIWAFSMELQGLANEHNDPNNSGDGCAMAWQAGAEFALMERSMRLSGGFRYPAYGTGNASNTWFACNIVDARGKEIPWVNRDGQVLKTISERYRPAPGQKYTLHDPASFPTYEIQGSSLIPDLSDRIIKGEFVLPFYADLPSMPEHERRAIFGLMIGNEGKTRIPIYYNYTKAGFNPDEDMLQANVLPPRSAGPQTLWWQGVGPPQWRGVAFVFGGGLLVDWDLRTNLQGLYAAGNQVMGTGTHTMAATTGRYVGRTAAAYSKIAEEPVVSKGQILAEKARVYAPVKQNEGLGWKELQSGISRIMQDYCGEYKSEDTLKLGLKWLKSFRESEIPRACARNPHELWRTLEVVPSTPG
jgi:succinate dehydrogenase/fumarate reductase flavoprotein subunit